MRVWPLPLLALSLVACAETAAPPKTPDQPPPPAVVVPPERAFLVEGALREEWIPLLKAPVVDPAKIKLDAPPPGLPAPPASCDAYVSRKGSGKASCADTTAALAALDAAMGEADAAKRDAALVDLEGCAAFPAGIARAIRIELAPTECGDAIADGWLKALPAQANGDVVYAILGQAIAARLSRTAHGAPAMKPPFDKARVLEFLKGPMIAWVTDQARIIDALSRSAVELPAYGKGVAAVEAGVADLRVVEAMREAPIPEEFHKDKELKDAYYSSLDQILGPRKDRGRDAALVGLKELALYGVINDGRVGRARALLSKLYGGRRIDAFDGMILPAAAPFTPSNVEERLASKLPTFYAGLLLDSKAATRAGTLRAFVERGLPLPQRAAAKGDKLSPEARELFARGRLELFRKHLRAVDVDRAIALLTEGGTPSTDEGKALLAIAIGLRNGPEDAADMMRKAARGVVMGSMGKLDALDFVAHTSPPNKHASIAAFDAAWIKQVAVPEGADAAYWTDVAVRFRGAATGLTDAKQRALAEDRAKAAEEIAKFAGAAAEKK